MGHLQFNSNWDNVTAQTRNNLVFEERNKAYGAFVIRRDYDRSVIYALIISSSLLIVGSCIPMIIQLFTSEKDQDIELFRDVIIITPPSVDKPVKVIVPDNPAVVAPVKTSIEWVVPDVSDDIISAANMDQTIEKPGTTTASTNFDDGDDVYIPEVSGTTGTSLIDDGSEKPFIYVEQMPEFPGGMPALMKFIGERIIFPEFEKSNGISGVIYMTFVVTKEGKVSAITVERGIKGGPGFEEEARRVLSLLPAWIPGRNNGYPVNVQFTLPIAFTLNR